MARVIQFTPQNAPDFSGANVMTKVAMDYFTDAVNQGKATIKGMNDAVVARNDATIKEFINSIPRSEWENNQQTINDFITDIANKSGLMYSADAIEKYRDDRYDALTKKANTQFGYEQNKIQTDEMTENRSADIIARTQFGFDKAIENASNPVEKMLRTKERDDWLNSQLPLFSPSVFQKADNLATQFKIDEQKNLDSLIDLTAKGLDSQFSGLANHYAELDDALYSLTQSTDEKYTKEQREADRKTGLNTQENIKKHMYDTVLKQTGNPIVANRVVDKAIQNGLAKYSEKVKNHQSRLKTSADIQNTNANTHKTLTDAAYIPQRVVNETKKVETDKIVASTGQTNATTSRMKAEFEIAKTAHEIQEGSRDESLKALDKVYGKGWQVDNKLNAPKVLNRIRQGMQEIQYTTNNPTLNSADYAKQKRDIYEKINKNIGLAGSFVKLNAQQIESVLDEVKVDGKPISNYEKIQAMSALGVERSAVSRSSLKKDAIELVTSIRNENKTKGDRDKKVYLGKMISDLDRAGYSTGHIINQLNLKDKSNKDLWDFLPDHIRKEVTAGEVDKAIKKTK